MCSCGCGQPAQTAHDPESDGYYEVDEDTVCYAGAALDTYRADLQRQKREQAPGQLLRVVDVRRRLRGREDHLEEDADAQGDPGAEEHGSPRLRGPLGSAREA